MSFRFGDVVLILFPFTNQQGHKPRPAVVISSSAYNEQKPDAILAAITSQIRDPLGFGEALIQDWQAAGLLKPSVLKPVLFTAEQRLLTRTLGTLSAHDQQTVRQVLGQVTG